MWFQLTYYCTVGSVYSIHDFGSANHPVFKDSKAGFESRLCVLTHSSAALSIHGQTLLWSSWNPSPWVPQTSLEGVLSSMSKEALTCLVGVILHWVSLSLRSLVDIPPTLPWVPNFHSRVGKGARECTLPKDRHVSAAHGQPQGTADPAHHSIIVPIPPPQQGAGAQPLLCVLPPVPLALKKKKWGFLPLHPIYIYTPPQT